MKLVRFGPLGEEKPGVIDQQGAIRDLSSAVPDYRANGISLRAIERIKALDLDAFPIVTEGERLGSCIASPPNFYCIGLNYAKHADEAGMAHPTEPIVFNKATSSVSGPNDAVIIPRNSKKSDWEIELGVVIGTQALYVSEADALNYVAGYCIVNDLSEREFQLERNGQWVKGKSAPTFGPLGPWLVTRDEITDPQTLDLRLSLNGDLIQNSNTNDMIFSVAQIISHLSQFMKLLPGDIIATGTPSGVGMGMNPQRFLRAGDRMELEIQGLGRQQQQAVTAD